MVYGQEQHQSLIQPEPILVPWKLKKKTLKTGSVGKEVHNTEGGNEIALDLTLGCPPFDHAKNCGIIQHEMLGGGPPDEDRPAQLQIQGQLLFDFFGLGQQAIQQQPKSAPTDAIPQVNGLKLYLQIQFCWGRATG
jgi:hypothetical protein